MRLHRHRRLVGLAALGARRDRRLRPRLLRAPEALHRRPRRRGAARRDGGQDTLRRDVSQLRARDVGARTRDRTAGGRRYVRFEDFETSNGPALKVYLSAAPASGPGDGFDDRFVDLGDLKGNIGSQNYTIPAGVRLDRYRSVVVWCKRFSVPFAAAPL